MTQEQDGLFRNLSTSQEFLFCQSDLLPGEARPPSRKIQIPADLARHFPAMLSGQAFSDQAADRFADTDRFAALVLRIDAAPPGEQGAARAPDPGIKIDVARTLDAVCSEVGGFWGLLEADLFGCLSPEDQQTGALTLASRIQQRLAELGPQTVSVGAAVFPLLDYSRDRILGNARKALDHAAFFGPGSAVLFDAVSLNISGDICYQHNKIEDAVAEFKAALRLDPANVNVHNSLGVCYGVRGDFAKASAAFQEALRLDPQETMAVYNLGLVSLMTDDNDKALEYFLKADQQKDVFEVALQTGKLYLQMARAEQAKPYLEKAIGLNSNSGVAYRHMGECCLALNLIDEAVSAFKKAVKYNPNDADSLSALGYLFDLQGENPEITTIFCQQSVDIAPDNGLFRYRLGNLYLKRNQLDDALEQFQKADERGHVCEHMIQQVQKLLQAS